MLKKVFEKLLVTDTNTTGYDELRKWMETETSPSFPELSKEVLSKIIHNAHMMHPESPEIAFTFDRMKHETKTLQELKQLVEQRRTEVKESRWQLEVFRTALRQLERWKGGTTI